MRLSSVTKFFLLSILVIGSFFSFTKESFAQEEKAIGRICDMQFSIIGVNEDTVNRIKNFSIEEQANYLENNPNTFCSLENKKANEGDYRGGAYYSFGSNVNLAGVYRKFSSLTKSDAEKESKPAAFFRDNIMISLEPDGSEFFCYPIPIEVLDLFQRQRNIYTNIDTGGLLQPPVTENSCPESEGRYYKDVGNSSVYLIGANVTTGRIIYEGTNFKEPSPVTKNGIDIVANIGKDLNIIKATSVPQLIGQLLSILMGIIGSISLAVVVAAGILWMTAAGNSSREKLAMEMIFWGALGVIVILASFAIVQLIFTDLF